MNQCLYLFDNPLHPRATGMQRVFFLAPRAGRGQGQAVITVMAMQRATFLMHDQPRAAVRTLKTMATGAAQYQRRIAAAIKKQNRLMTGSHRISNCLSECGGNKLVTGQFFRPHHNIIYEWGGITNLDLEIPP